jgi:hypothetical protein
VAEDHSTGTHYAAPLAAHEEEINTASFGEPKTPPGWYMPLDDMTPAEILKFHGPAVCDFVLAARARIARLKWYANYLEFWNLQRGKYGE